MRILLVFFISIVIGFSSFVKAQVTFTEQAEVRSLMAHYITMGQSDDVIDGWRIKIISTTNRRALERAKYKFQKEYPEMSFVQDYEAPYYSLKTGAFETRFDVEPLLVQFKMDFSSAIPFRDRITKQELFTQDGE